MRDQWDDYKQEFEWDGSLRDIYVLGTSIEDWQVLLESLKTGAYQYVYFVNGEEVTLPLSLSVKDILNRSAARLLVVTSGPITLNSHFFRDDEIEFDLDPRQIKSAVEVELLFGFMSHFGRLLNKEVILTPENCQTSAIFRFAPDVGEVQYIPPHF